MTRDALAYENHEFLDSDEARPLRILAEYLGPLRTFTLHEVHDTIVFFGSARVTPDGPLGRYYDCLGSLHSLAGTFLQMNTTMPVFCHLGNCRIVSMHNCSLLG